MSTLVSTFLSYLLIYKYGFLFVFIFVSAVALPLPDNLTLLATGAFASQGYFNFWLAFGVVILANVAGDSFGYFLADRFGPEVIRRSRLRMPWFVTQVERYIGSYAGITIVVTRFVGTIDSLVNILSGLIDIPYPKFLFYDVIGNTVSLFYVLYIGYVVGDNWINFSGIVSTVGWIFFGLVIILILALLWRSARARQHSKN